MKDITLTLNNPLSEEDWDKITDVDMEHTSRVWFNTKNGKKVEFVKPKKGKWSKDMVGIRAQYGDFRFGFRCSECGAVVNKGNFCPNCGADMRGEETWNG